MTLEKCFFQISSYSPVYVHIIYEKTKGPVPLRPLLGKQNIQANYKRSILQLHACSNIIMHSCCKLTLILL